MYIDIYNGVIWSVVWEYTQDYRINALSPVAPFTNMV